MVNDVEWRSLDVMAAEGMSLRVGAFKSSDGTIVEFSPDMLKKVFAKVKDPLPMYLTHKDAGTGKPREVLGHAVKLGLEANGDKIHFKAIMMDPSFKLMYASGYDDTSAEIDIVRDEVGNVVDGTLTGFAVVPNPAISGTEMKVSAIAFQAHEGGCTTTSTSTGTSYSGGYIPPVLTPTINQSSGGIKLTGRIEKSLLESGVPADKVEALMGTMEAHFSKKFEHDGLQAKFEAQKQELELACSKEKEMKKKFEDLSAEFEAYLGEKVATLVNEVKGMNFANPEAVVEGLPVQQKITMLSKIKENLVAKTPAAAPAANLQAAPPAAPQAKFEDMLMELGVKDLWNSTHKEA